ncbi:MAG: hypothetical protein DMG61_17675 [Acidobacteria bacterium]|nr:MAG: hypothetical protein DMG61_17675 [Acidobacteriota bacterium]
MNCLGIPKLVTSRLRKDDSDRSKVVAICKILFPGTSPLHPLGMAAYLKQAAEIFSALHVSSAGTWTSLIQLSGCKHIVYEQTARRRHPTKRL